MHTFKSGDKARLKRALPYLSAGTVVEIHNGPDSDGDYLVSSQSPVPGRRTQSRYVHKSNLEPVEEGTKTTYGNLKPGQRVRVTFEGTAESLRRYGVPQDFRLRVDGASTPIGSNALRKAVAFEVLPEPVVPSVWEAGDVVIVRFGGPSSSPYTYVRLADGSWSGNLTDAEADERIDNGQAVWAMRAGLPVASGDNVPKRPNGVAPISLPF